MLGMPRFVAQSALFSLLLSFSFSSCIRVGDLSSNAMRYNEAVEEAQNKMLLLNIVRAKMHRPMYITDLSKITGNIKLDINTGPIETDYTPFVQSTTTTDPMTKIMTTTSPARNLFGGKLVPSVDYAHSPTFDVNVLSTQEFMNGFLKPASKDLLSYYWEQGWPQELLLYLFVHHVRVHSSKDFTEADETFENHPSKVKPAELEKFGNWVTAFLKQKPTFVKKDLNIGPCLSRDEVSELDDLVAASKAGFGLAEVPTGGYQLQQPKPDLELKSEYDVRVAQEVESLCKKVQKPPKTPIEVRMDLLTAARKAATACREGLATLKDEKKAENKKVSREKLESIEEVCKFREDIVKGIDKGIDDDRKLGCSSPCSGAEQDAANEESSGVKSGQGETRGAEVSARYGEGANQKEATLYLRSPEGILYYLGQLMRLEEDANIVPEICVDGYLEPLFVAFARSKTDRACSAAIAVEYNGRNFVVPDEAPPADKVECKEGGNKYATGVGNLKCYAGRSMQALSLLTQLIALQKSAKDTPTTGVIRAISQ
jgi:hypothetical protein